MTVKDKADEISGRYASSKVIPTNEEVIAYNSAIKMSDWLIERAAAWLENNYHDYEWRDDFDMNQLIVDFRQCLKTDSL